MWCTMLYYILPFLSTSCVMYNVILYFTFLVYILCDVQCYIIFCLPCLHLVWCTMLYYILPSLSTSCVMYNVILYFAFLVYILCDVQCYIIFCEVSLNCIIWHICVSPSNFTDHADIATAIEHCFYPSPRSPPRKNKNRLVLTFPIIPPLPSIFECGYDDTFRYTKAY